MKKNNYKFVGVIDSFNMCPDFVRPVFERGGKYYFQMGKNGVISSFRELSDIMVSKIRFLVDINITSNNLINYDYGIGDEAIICFRLYEDVFFVSDIDNFVLFIKYFETNDDILKEEIDMFMEGVNRRNIAKKKILKNEI